MTITAANDTVTYKSARGDADTVRPAELVVAVNKDGTPIGAGTSASSLGKAEDAAHVSGDTGVMTLGVRKDTAASFGADGDYIPLRTDQYGDQHVLLTGADGAALAMVNGGVPVSQTGYSFTNITTATTTTVKSGAGVLKGVTVNTKGTIASTITIYDNTAGSGTKIGIIDSLNLAGQFLYDLAFATGLTLVTTGTVAPDITVSYR